MQKASSIAALASLICFNEVQGLSDLKFLAQTGNAFHNLEANKTRHPFFPQTSHSLQMYSQEQALDSSSNAHLPFQYPPTTVSVSYSPPTYSSGPPPFSGQPA
jgi:hypothetical protein